MQDMQAVIGPKSTGSGSEDSSEVYPCQDNHADLPVLYLFRPA